jgi:hypothetical protein
MKSQDSEVCEWEEDEKVVKKDSQVATIAIKSNILYRKKWWEGIKENK